MSVEHDEEVLSELVDGRLDASRRAEVERHLAGCETCRTLADDLRRLRADAARLPVQQPPARVWAQIAAQLPARQPAWRRAFGRPFGSARARLAWGGVALAAAATLVV